MLSLDGTLIVQLVNFIVFLAVLNVIFFKPVGVAIAKRRAYIEGLAKDIEELQMRIKTLRGQADERRIAARREADERLAAARVEAARETDALVSQAQDGASEIVAKAHSEVSAELASARKDEPRIVETLANQMLDRALGGAA